MKKLLLIPLVLLGLTFFVNKDESIQTKKQETVVKKVSTYSEFIVGAPFEFQLESNLKYTGEINCVQKDNEITHIGGTFHSGTFFFNIDDNQNVTGYVFVNNKFAYELVDSVYPVLNFKKRPISEVICFNPSNIQAEGIVSSGTSNSTNIVKVPILESLPSASFVLYLEFNGTTIQDPVWNGGKLFKVNPSGLSEGQIREVFSIVSEKYAPFRVNVTTDVTKYDSAKSGSKMRMVVGSNIIPTVMPNGFAGMAFTNAIKGIQVKQLIPTHSGFIAVDKLQNSNNVGEATAHEFGHTFGLKHDGTVSEPYYKGNMIWGPVMGASYNKVLVQWNNGDYLNANNKEDDVTIISKNTGVGFAHNPTTTTATAVYGKFTSNDTVVNNKDVRAFVFNTQKGGNVSFDVYVPTKATLKPVVEVYDKATNKTIFKQTSNYGNVVSIVGKVPKGTYVVKVTGGGEGNPLTSGYSNYGSIGRYTIKGNVPSDSIQRFGSTVTIK